MLVLNLMCVFSFLEYPTTDLKEVFHESSPNKPIVLFTISADIVSSNILFNYFFPSLKKSI